MVEARGGYGDRRRGFTRVSSPEEHEEDIEHVLVTNSSSRARQQAVVHANSNDGGVIWCGSRKVQVSGVREDGRRCLRVENFERSTTAAGRLFL